MTRKRAEGWRPFSDLFDEMERRSRQLEDWAAAHPLEPKPGDPFYDSFAEMGRDMTYESAGERAIRAGEERLRSDLGPAFGDLMDLVGAPGEAEPGSGKRQPVARSFVTWAVPEESELADVARLGLVQEQVLNLDQGVRLFNCRDHDGKAWTLLLVPREEARVTVAPTIAEGPQPVPGRSLRLALARALAAVSNEFGPQADDWSRPAVERWLREMLADGGLSAAAIWQASEACGIDHDLFALVRRGLGVVTYPVGEGKDTVDYYYLPVGAP